MRVGRVIGSVVSTIKDEKLHGAKLLVVEPLEANSQEPFVAIDTVGAGKGEIVLVSTGGAARLQGVLRDAPVDASITAIVDQLESDGWANYARD